MQKPEQEAYPNLNVNFWTFVFNLVILRIGWVFKTETVIMPGFLDAMGGSATIRGWLPVMGRLGQSVPQFLFAHTVRGLRRQKWAFVAMSLLQVVPWAVMCLLLTFRSLDAAQDKPRAGSAWIIFLFLFLYALFWSMNGITVLLGGTLQGKLIPPQRRGSLLAVSSFWGCALAIGAAFLFMRPWLDERLVEKDRGYALVFGAVATFFFLSALCGLFFSEPADTKPQEGSALGEFVANAFRLLKRDPNFRRLVLVVTLYYVVLILFPHYAAFARRRLNIGEEGYVLWIAVQNAMNGLSSLLIGPLADRHGNRIALCTLTVVAGVTPLLSIGLNHAPGVGRELYWMVFLLLGFTPVSQRIITNYTLEIASREQHALYLGTLNLFQGLPLLASPLVGWLIKVTSFELIFALGAATIFAGGAMAQGLTEPRRGMAREVTRGKGR